MKQITFKIILVLIFISNLPTQVSSAAHREPTFFGEVCSVEEDFIKVLAQCSAVTDGRPMPKRLQIPTNTEEAIDVICSSKQLFRIYEKLQRCFEVERPYGTINFIANTPEEAEGGILLVQGIAHMLGREVSVVSEENLSQLGNYANGEIFVVGPDVVATERGVLSFIRAWNLAGRRGERLERRLRATTNQRERAALVQALYRIMGLIRSTFVVSIGAVEEPPGPHGFYARMRETICLSSLIKDSEYIVLPPN